MSGCFDFRLRSSPSVDLNHIQSDRESSSSKIQISLSKLFRSKSDSNVKARSHSTDAVRSNSSSSGGRSRPLRSPSPVGGAPVTPGAARRRYVRVIRSDDPTAVAATTRLGSRNDNNCHVIVRSHSYGSVDRRRLKKSSSADTSVTTGIGGDPGGGGSTHRTMSPYAFSVQTILKKYNQSLDAATSDTAGPTRLPEISPPTSKHTSFRDEVEILEYDTGGKALMVKCSTHTTKLNDDDDEDEDDSLNIDDSFDELDFDPINPLEPDPELKTDALVDDRPETFKDISDSKNKTDSQNSVELNKVTPFNEIGNNA